MRAQRHGLRDIAAAPNAPIDEYFRPARRFAHGLREQIQQATHTVGLPSRVIREHGATNIVFEPAARIAHALVSSARQDRRIAQNQMARAGAAQFSTLMHPYARGAHASSASRRNMPLMPRGPTTASHAAARPASVVHVSSVGTSRSTCGSTPAP
ncbi:hypothetical protein AN416_34165 (plasmid) [Paraburkholderia caribensis]|nr:hypothetical protein AN416_34165 [Paraburkholderia caribensis]